MKTIILLLLVSALLYTATGIIGYKVGLDHGYRDAAQEFLSRPPLPVDTLEYRPAPVQTPEGPIWL